MGKQYRVRHRLRAFQRYACALWHQRLLGLSMIRREAAAAVIRAVPLHGSPISNPGYQALSKARLPFVLTASKFRCRRSGTAKDQHWGPEAESMTPAALGQPADLQDVRHVVSGMEPSRMPAASLRTLVRVFDATIPCSFLSMISRAGVGGDVGRPACSVRTSFHKLLVHTCPCRSNRNVEPDHCAIEVQCERVCET